MKLSSFTIQSNQNIKKAFKFLKKYGKKCLIVIDKDKKMLGTLTDGDIRNSILKKNSINTKIEKIYNSNPKYLLQGNYTNSQALKLLVKHNIELIPIVNQKKKIINIVELNTLLKSKNKIVKNKFFLNIFVIIMAGGVGTRLRPFTKVLPKPLVPVNNRPIIDHIIDRFQDQGLKKIILTINDKAEIMKAYFNETKSQNKIKFLEETKPLGTCGGLSFLCGKINKSFFVTNCDIILNLDFYDLYSFHVKNNYDITVVASTKDFAIPYGICEINSQGLLQSMIEKPKYNHLVNTGLYVINPRILSIIPRNKKYDFNELFDDAKRKKKKVGVYPIDEKSWIDVGQWSEYKKAIEKL